MILLFTEDSRASSEKLAGELGISRVYSECDSVKKMNAIDEILDELDANKKLMYVSAENLDFHTAADIDTKVGYASENADMLMSNVGVFGLPVAFTNSKRTKSISMENEIFSNADGKVVGIAVSDGASVNTGDTIITLG